MTVPIKSAGKRSGRELHARELGVDRVAHRAHGERLGEPGDAFEQDVTAREQPHQNALDHLLLTDDDLADFGRQVVDEGTLFGDDVVQRSYVLHGKNPRPFSGRGAS